MQEGCKGLNREGEERIKERKRRWPYLRAAKSRTLQIAAYGSLQSGRGGRKKRSLLWGNPRGGKATDESNRGAGVDQSGTKEQETLQPGHMSGA